MENYFKMNFTAAQVNAMTNLALAHMGDGVYELLVRSMLCTRGDKTVQKLHRDTVELVKAPTQARFADKLLPHLTEEEAAYYRRGKNSHTHAAPKSASPKEYAKATGLEALFGYLHLNGERSRIEELFSIIVGQAEI
jgi:ribonuclease-3 family protein